MLEHPPERPMSRGEKWAYAIFLLVMLGMFVADLATAFRPVKLGALFVILWWIPLLALHELGHAAVARWLGWRVSRVVIGFGRTFKRFRVGRTEVELRALPLEGFTVPRPTSLHRVRLKSALVYAAGVGAELALLAVVALVAGPRDLFTPSSSVPMIAAQSLGVAVGVSVFVNLVPHTSMAQHGPNANDGLGILRSLLAPRSSFSALVDDDPSSAER